MNQSYTKSERVHIEAIKRLQCSVCDFPAPSQAHHIRQSEPYLCVALCESCHKNGFNGWHGQRAIWRVKKMDEYDALSVTLRRLFE